MKYDLKTYQHNTFNKLSTYNKSIIIWSRQIGKSYLIDYYLENYIINNSDKDILFYLHSGSMIKNRMYEFLSNLNNRIIINKIYSKKITCINNNWIYFNEFKPDVIGIIRPDLIIFDEYYYEKNQI